MRQPNNYLRVALWLEHHPLLLALSTLAIFVMLVVPTALILYWLGVR